MNSSRDELLRPTIGTAALARAPYSIQVMFLTAFFGGPFSAIAIVAVNAARLQRWLRDLAPLALATALYVAFVIALEQTEWGAQLRASLTSLAGPRGPAYMHRLIALALCGLGYALHAREQRSADLMGLDRPSGWVAGLLCAIGGSALLIALHALAGAGGRA